MNETSFLRRQEPSGFKSHWIPACAGMTNFDFEAVIHFLNPGGLGKKIGHCIFRQW